MKGVRIVCRGSNENMKIVIVIEIEIVIVLPVAHKRIFFLGMLISYLHFHPHLEKNQWRLQNIGFLLTILKNVCNYFARSTKKRTFINFPPIPPSL